MPTSLEKLGIDQLGPEKQLELIGEIWDNLTAKGEHRIPDSHKEELDRRLAEADASPDQAESWDVVRARLWADRLDPRSWRARS